MKRKLHCIIQSLLLILFLTISHYGYSQTYIGPSIGINFSHLKGDFKRSVKIIKDPLHFFFTEPGFNNISPEVGFVVVHQINDFFLISIGSNYMRKYSTLYNIIWDANPKQIRFTQFNTSILLNYKLMRKWHTGIGANISTFNNFKSRYSTKSNWTLLKKYNSIYFSLALSSSYFYKSFVFELKYFQSVKRYIYNESSYSDYETNGFKAIKTYEFSVSYMFKIFDKWKGRDKVKCPKM